MGLTFASKPNITLPNYSDPGASTVLVVTLLMFATTIFAGKKKRSPENLSNPYRDLENQILFQVLDISDHNDCIANTICFVSSKNIQSRSPLELKLLSIIGNQPEIPMMWSDMHKPEAKYRYAGFVGAKTAPSVCQGIFKSCPVSPEHIVGTLTNTNHISEANILSRLWSQSVQYLLSSTMKASTTDTKESFQNSTASFLSSLKNILRNSDHLTNQQTSNTLVANKMNFV